MIPQRSLKTAHEILLKRSLFYMDGNKAYVWPCRASRRGACRWSIWSCRRRSGCWIVGRCSYTEVSSGSLSGKGDVLGFAVVIPSDDLEELGSQGENLVPSSKPCCKSVLLEEPVVWCDSQRKSEGKTQFLLYETSGP